MNTRSRPFVAIAFAVLGAALAVVLGLVLQSASAIAKAVTLSGAVTYRERLALPASAIVEVQLVDVSLADAPAKTIARTSVRSRGQVPVQYRLRFDEARIEPGRSYALQAQITVAGRLWFASATRHPIFAGGADETDILVQRVSDTPASNAPKRPDGRWLAENIPSGRRYRSPADDP